MTKYSNVHVCVSFQEQWGKELVQDKFVYEDLKTNDEELLKWLLTMEIKGVALVQNAPDDPDAGAQLIDHIGFVKQSHYGRRSPVIVREHSNNVAFSNIKLGLHNDLSQYYHQAGMIFIQVVKQHVGKGGESTISDGLHAVEILRNKHPKALEMLSKNSVYFWDKGVANLSMERDSFYKIIKAPVIG
ncbi:UNVERIFIED_CONTAM: hypothetical protein GTU68_059097 [Idotea baltica]|nr:hypothetical protein [Idotea baltica]